MKKFVKATDALLNRITSNPLILTSNPVVRGMRISLEQILKMLPPGISRQDIIDEYPLLEENISVRVCFLKILKNNFSVYQNGKLRTS